MEDFNLLLDLANQMDLEFSQEGIEKYIPNSTKCLNWQDVRASHDMSDATPVIAMGDIYGKMILLALGLGGALVVLLMECVSKTMAKRLMKMA